MLFITYKEICVYTVTYVLSVRIHIYLLYMHIYFVTINESDVFRNDILHQKRNMLFFYKALYIYHLDKICMRV